MKIDIKKKIVELEELGFTIRNSIFANTKCYYIFPSNIGCDYRTKENLKFRSSIWTTDGELISASFPKFFNWTEQPELCPEPTDIKDCEFIEKLDGSCLIVSKFKGELIIRTRRSETAYIMDNGYELDELKDRYPLVFDNPLLDLECNSLLFEWTSPVNRIVLDYGDKPDIKLIGAIDHYDYSMAPQYILDELAFQLDVQRPNVFHYDTLGEMIKGVKSFKGMEGVVCYYDEGQSMKKIKGDEYLKYHFIRTSLNDNKLIELVEYLDYPSKTKFKKHITSEFDWECYQFIEPRVDLVYDIIKDIKIMIKNAWTELNNHINNLGWDKRSGRGDIAKYMNTDKFYSVYYKDYISIMFMKLDDRWNYTDQNCKNWLRKQIKKELIKDD